MADNCRLVPVGSMKRLQKQVCQLSWNLSSLFSSQLFNVVHKLPEIESELAAISSMKEKLETEVSHWQAQTSILRNKYLHEKEEKFLLGNHVQELLEKLSSQSDFCTQLGSVCCTMLWRVSQMDNAVVLMLHGSAIEKLLQLIVTTLESYMSALHEEAFELNGDLNEFIVALCGIIANIAAVSEGRTFLVESSFGRSLLQVLLAMISADKPAVSIEMKRLSILALYNISINKSGHKQLSSLPGLLGIMAKTIEIESDIEVHVLCFQLIQSLLFEQEDARLFKELKEVLPFSKLQKVSSVSCKKVADIITELCAVIQMWEQQQ